MPKLDKLPIQVIGGGVIFVILLVGFLILVSSKRGTVQVQKQDEISASVEVGSKKTVVNSNGNVSYYFPSGTTQRTLSPDVVRNLLKYLGARGNAHFGAVAIDGNYIKVVFIVDGVTHIVYFSPNDPVVKDLLNGGDGSGNSGGGNTNPGGFSFSSTPTPRPGGTAATSTPSSGTGFVIPSDCPLWLLSFCDYPAPPAPTMVPSKTPPNSPIPDCSYWNQFIQGDKAVVSNTLCIK